MALYLSRVSYTAEAWRALINKPEDRKKVVNAMIADSGATLKELWYAFGDYDAYALIEAPDNATAASVALAVASSGAFSRFETTPLLSMEETMEALKKAQAVAYRPPGG
jgi:uncharacterized protein with GYD domain